MAGSNATKSVLSELAKRVPSNQAKQFRKFLDLNIEYKRRVDKYPEKLPKIDWDYYRTNVRVEAIKMVDEFEKKYEELNRVFDDRFKLDTKKYYDELEQQRAEVQAQVKQYIAESNERIKAFEAEIARLCHMKPYSAMTMEEFINLRPECSEYIPHSRKPLFWPHDPDEQILGPPRRITPVEGGDGDGGASGSTYPIKPSDIRGETEKFEFGAADGKTMKEKTEPTEKLPKKSAAAPITIENVDTDEMEKEEIEKPRQTKEQQTQQRKKPHPCDLIKHKDATATDGGTCKPRRPHKDGENIVFFDPCGVGFGVKKGDKSSKEITVPKSEALPQSKKSEKMSSLKVKPKENSNEIGKSKENDGKVDEPKIHIDKPPSKKLKEKLDPCKIMEKEERKNVEYAALPEEKEAEALKLKTGEEKYAPPKKPHPCDLIEQLPDDLCKPKGSAVDKNDTCAFFDPCNVGFGSKKKVEKAASEVKSKPQTKVNENLTKPKTNKNLSKEVSKPTQDITCKTKKQNKDENEEKIAFVPVGPCGFDVKKESKSQSKDSEETTLYNSTEEKQKDDTEYCKDPDSDIATKSPCNAAKKPKRETSIIKDENSVTLVFADPKEKLCKDGDPKRQSTSPCKEEKTKKPIVAAPYYNPFRSEEENKKIENVMCDISKNEDPCSSKKRDTEEDYYDPCKDEKE